MSQKMITGKPELMKKINRSLIIKLIVQEGEISRSQLARMTGLALPSIMRIVDGLIENGIVEETGKGDSSGGRKPSLVRLNPEYKLIVGIEIAVDTTMVITNIKGAVVAAWTSAQIEFETPQALLERLLVELERMIVEHKIDSDRIAGVGIGTPGMNFKYQREVKGSILKGWEQIDVGDWFRARTPYLVVVENVARTRTLRELWFGMGKALKSFLYVFVDQGVGVGIVENGVIYKGANGVAGEFGHMSVDYNGRPCYCGNKGCIEMYVSAGALAQDMVGLSSAPKFEALYESCGTVLAFGIANLVNIYNPEAIILGGVVPYRYPELAQQVETKLSQYIFHNDALGTPLYVSQLDSTNNCLGSIALVIDERFSESGLI